MKKQLLIIVIAAVALVLAACNKGDAAPKAEDDKKVVIGVTGTDGEQWEVLKSLAKEEGIDVELKEFSDYTLPNKALADGDVDLNSFQHIAFLSQFEQEHKTNLTPIGSTFIAPLGIYSTKITDISEIKDGDKIAIPDDPSNQGRALRLLEAAGLLTLDASAGLFGDTTHIKENPKNLEILPMVAQQTPRVLEDVAVSLINNGVAVQAGFHPLDDPIYIEDGDSADPYINVFAARDANKDNEVLNRIVALYHDPKVIEAANKELGGGAIVIDRTPQELAKILTDLQGGN